MRIEVFEGHQFPIMEIEGQPWFRAKPICKALEIEQVTQAVERVPDQHKQKMDIRNTVFTEHGIAERGNLGDVWFVSHEGLLRLVMQSRSPRADPLQAHMARVVAQYQRGELGSGVAMERLLGAVVRMLDRLEAIERRLDGRLGAMPYGKIAALPLGTTVREPGMLVVRLPSDEEYHTVRFELIRQHILVTDRGQRAKLGRLVAGRYRVEAQSHPDWPSSPILVDRAGNHYPPQTWEWLAEAVQRVAGEMGLLPGTAVHQASLWNGTGGPLDVSVTVP